MDARVDKLPAKTLPIRPFLKWAGNKYRIIDRIKKLLPTGKRLIEPFVGSAAVFLNTDYPSYLLCDNNPDLINLYNLLKKDGDKFIRYCQPYFNGQYNNAESYYALRDKFNTSKNLRQKAALFIYLNRHGYNGLCRYNQSGGYNVPFGRYVHPYFPAKEMRAFHHKAQNAEFKICPFEDTINNAQKGDVIYCDPPYAPLTSSADFTNYSPGGFNIEQQTKLAQLAQYTATKNIPVLLSNHDTDFTRKVYKQANKQYFNVRRYISCNGEKRDHAGEILALFG
ncbi:MAG: Dam family site-specific DNA-(adenine-N6)-methyltransferase [Gammaproteobacteria bacterium]|nr:Dam family site-specific DNA-(adenine-N6)-methyltransferase [Gammaproteobacteria bacterium]